MKKRSSMVAAFTPLVCTAVAVTLRGTFSFMDLIYYDSAVIAGVISLLLGLVAVVMAIVNMIRFSRHAAKNPRVDGDMRMIWIVCMILFVLFAPPVYWFVHLRKEA